MIRLFVSLSKGDQGSLFGAPLRAPPSAHRGGGLEMTQVRGHVRRLPSGGTALVSAHVREVDRVAHAPADHARVPLDRGEPELDLFTPRPAVVLAPPPPPPPAPLKEELPEATAPVRLVAKLAPAVNTAKLRALGDALDATIAAKRSSGASQNYTARRARIAAGASEDADRLEETKNALYALADVADDNGGTLPEGLRGLRNRATVETVLSELRHNGAGSIAFYAEHLGNMTRSLLDDGDERLPRKWRDDPKLLAEIRETAAEVRKHLRAAKPEGWYFDRGTEPSGRSDRELVLPADLVPRLRPFADESYINAYAFDRIRRLIGAGITTPEAWATTLAAWAEHVAPRMRAGEAGRREAAEQRALRAKEKEVANAGIAGFFPTPPELASRLWQGATDLLPRGPLRVLEPSAGTGSMLAVPEATGHKIVVGEVNHTLRQILRGKGFETAADDGDFLALTREKLGKVDLIIQNPPFEKNQDIAHVRHAYSLIRPGGVVASITSAHPDFANDAPSRDYRAWLDGLEASGEATVVREANPEGSFLNADRSTGVSTRSVWIRKNR